MRSPIVKFEVVIVNSESHYKGTPNHTIPV